ncbi:hypothetical protein [uncultured Microbacterium sp.]|uniref:hypothetical protein n=1 Tax=uncultured Microbacterium sp. TaxID=191216 RepID=UPI0025CBB4B9|nr:hypothetical protein [uncultured Microbacterium sp.]
MYEIRRVVRAGVRETADVLECPELGLRVGRERPEAVENGLCSEVLMLRLGRRSWSLPPWFTTGARSLPHGIGRASLACLCHFGSGMALLLVVCGAVVAAGSGLGSLALVALGTIGLLLLSSILVHELGLVLLYRILMGREAPAVMIVRGATCRVLRLAGRPAADVGVVVAGSAAPLFVALLCWPFYPAAPSAVLLGTLVAIGHVVGLAAPFGDGATLREIARGR